MVTTRTAMPRGQAVGQGTRSGGWAAQASLRLTDNPALLGLVVVEHGEVVRYISFAAARLCTTH